MKKTIFLSLCILLNAFSLKSKTVVETEVHLVNVQEHAHKVPFYYEDEVELDEDKHFNEDQIECYDFIRSDEYYYTNVIRGEEYDFLGSTEGQCLTAFVLILGIIQANSLLNH